MKEIIFLVFVSDYICQQNIPDLKNKVIEYLGKKMIADNCEGSPVLKLNQELDTHDVSSICTMISDTPGSSISCLYIKATEEESSILSGLMVELKPVG